MPIVLESALTYNVFILQMPASRFPGNFFVRLLDVWEVRRHMCCNAPLVLT